ncbi:uncharacterized protein C8orf48 homolog [Protopterus annectens]|uniref:uncharacterized protein C8orf48 homolog n=1 Tax=Protopterus annectens TaxID=7888 RepID=UPI001CFA7774|nr:uncharacterized protein C8orf48 homolog [Protopterus annectens]XP_043913646.1 uncharacterized protein C8orf48 homolog [Protopterus annectens]
MIENGEVLDGDSDALKSFCFAKIKQIQQQWEVKQPQDTEHETMSPTTKPRKPKEFFMTRSVPEKLLKRLQFRNITEMLKQAEAAEIHQPSHCTACLKKKEELAKAEFIKQKKALVESANLKEKIENQMYIRDPLTLIGEVLENFPKLSDDPSEIWKRLTAKLKK